MACYSSRILAPALTTLVLTGNAKEVEPGEIEIPSVRQTAKRPVTIDDISALRKVDSLSISPDGRQFAIFVRQGDPVANAYRTGWFVGSTSGGMLKNVGHGGDLEPRVLPNGQEEGPIGGGQSRWSPDNKWIAYTLRQGDEVQLWRSRVNGGKQEQVTHNAADVQDFAWNTDGLALYFMTGATRSKMRAAQNAKSRTGYQYDEDLNAFTDLLQSQVRPSLEPASSLWVVSLTDGRERLAGKKDRAAFALARDTQSGGMEMSSIGIGAPKSIARRSDGAVVDLIPAGAYHYRVRMIPPPARDDRAAVECELQECSGLIYQVWWSDDGKRVYFLKYDDTFGSAFYAWSPDADTVNAVVHLHDDVLQLCGKSVGDRIVCVRETPARPADISEVNLSSASLTVLAEVNPEFMNIQLGRVERYDWDLPKFDWNEPGGDLAGLFGSERHAYGYILYPPDFDPAVKYPVFIEPYIASGFDHPSRAEHALHVYAANGIVVLNMNFPAEAQDVLSALGSSVMSKLYSTKLNFPLLSMYAESTVRGFEVAARRGFIDRTRVGIGGVSHGTFVPLYMLQKYDLIAAISISSPHWGPFQYYCCTRKLRKILASESGSESWPPKPGANGERFWNGVDIADHVDTIEAPVLMHLADRETFSLLRLIRHMEDAGKPYDAYVFPKEGHIKWQPAHLHAIMTRNLDWFRFWLHGLEDRDPAKARQYARWRELRKMNGDVPAEIGDSGERGR